MKSPRWLVHPYICSKRPSRGSEIGSEALLAQMEPAVANSRSCERVRTVEGSGPESRARGFPLHGIDHWDGPACAGGPSAFILVPSVSAQSPPVPLAQKLGPSCWQWTCYKKTFIHETATMYARSVCVVHVYQVSSHSSAAHAYRKRRGGPRRMRRAFVQG